MKKEILSILCVVLIAFSCKKPDNETLNTTKMKESYMISKKELDTLATKKIYFGHQSVGFNIMDGIEMLVNQNHNLKLNIAQGNDLNLFDNPVFAHAPNGKNGDAISKIDDFVAIMDNGLGEKVNIAGFKFCYVDIKEETDIEDVFNHYKKKMDELILKYPDVDIIHFTAPLRTPQQGIKGFINSILGRKIGIENNLARQKFNELLLKEYQNRPIFDIAKYESTYPNGSREFNLVNNEKAYSVVPVYTNDGGHLSDKGKKVIGEEFLKFLVMISNNENGREN